MDQLHNFFFNQNKFFEDTSDFLVDDILPQGDILPSSKKVIKCRRRLSTKKMKRFFWKLYDKKYELRFPGKDFPQIGFTSSLIFYAAIRRWRKKVFYNRQRKFFFRKKYFTKSFLRTAVKKEIFHDTGVVCEDKKKRLKRYLKRGIFKEFKKESILNKRSLSESFSVLNRFLINPATFLNISESFHEIPLASRNHLNKKTLKRKVIGFLYKKPKNVLLKVKSRLQKSRGVVTETRKGVSETFGKFYKKSKTLFVNLYKKYSWKLRMARLVHWDTRVHGKLNEIRYIKLLGYELKLLKTTKLSQLLSYVAIRSFSTFISWFSLEDLREYVPIVFNGDPVNTDPTIEKGDMLEVPTGSVFSATKKFYKKHFKKVISKVKRLSYRSYLINTKQLKKAKIYINTPKAYKKLPIGLKKFGKTVTHELSAGLLSVSKKIPKLHHDLRNSLNLTTVLALQIWRYRFD